MRLPGVRESRGALRREGAPGLRAWRAAPPRMSRSASRSPRGCARHRRRRGMIPRGSWYYGMGAADISEIYQTQRGEDARGAIGSGFVGGEAARLVLCPRNESRGRVRSSRLECPGGDASGADTPDAWRARRARVAPPRISRPAARSSRGGATPSTMRRRGRIPNRVRYPRSRRVREWRRGAIPRSTRYQGRGALLRRSEGPCLVVRGITRSFRARTLGAIPRTPRYCY